MAFRPEPRATPGWADRLRALDAFPKARDEAAEFFERTAAGGAITLAAAAVMALLFLSELHLFLRVRTTHELSVDASRGEQLAVHFNVTFPRLPCAWLSVDAMDVSGEVHLDVAGHEVYKQRLDAGGRPLVAHRPVRHEVGPALGPPPDAGAKAAAAAAQAAADAAEEAAEAAGGCGSCYGAEDAVAGPEPHCCNSCADVQEAYRRKGWAMTDTEAVRQCRGEGYLGEVAAQAGEGCRVYGDLLVNKVRVAVVVGWVGRGGFILFHLLFLFCVLDASLKTSKTSSWSARSGPPPKKKRRRKKKTSA
jgi:hypothetical protein